MFKRQRDTAILKDILCISSFIYVFPRQEKNSRYAFIYIASYCSIGMTCLVRTYWRYFKNTDKPFMELIVPYCSIIVLTVFNLLCLKQFFQQKKLWLDLFNRFEAFDLKIGKSFDEIVLKEYLKLTFVNLFYGTIYAIIYCSSQLTSKIDNLIGVTFMYFSSTQILMTTVIFHTNCACFAKRCTSIIMELRDISRVKNGNYLKTLYLILKDCTKKINQIFGDRMLIIFFCTFLEVLSMFQFVVTDYPKNKPNHLTFLLSGLTNMTFLMVSIM